MSEIKGCHNCEHAIYDKWWGEIKCSIYQRRIVFDEALECPHYKRGEPKESKKEPLYE